MHVLVVHPDPRFYREVQPLLAAHEASGAYQSNLNDIRCQLEAHFPDLIVLEPGVLAVGEGSLGKAFGHKLRLPVIFLTSARSEHIQSGQERERLTALLRHVRNQSEHPRLSQILQVGNLRIHPGRMRVALNDQWVRLPPIQFRILEHLATNANELVPHQELMRSVWGYTATNEEARDLLKVHITQLRRKLGP